MRQIDVYLKRKWLYYWMIWRERHGFTYPNQAEGIVVNRMIGSFKTACLLENIAIRWKRLLGNITKNFREFYWALDAAVCLVFVCNWVKSFETTTLLKLKIFRIANDLIEGIILNAIFFWCVILVFFQFSDSSIYPLSLFSKFVSMSYVISLNSTFTILQYQIFFPSRSTSQVTHHLLIQCSF